MEDVQFGSLVVVSIAAFAVPMLFALIPGSSVPTMVGEVIAGILLGKSLLGWIESGPYLDFLFLFGLAFLLFLAGLEIDFPLLARSFSRGVRDLITSPLGLAVIGMVLRLVVAFAITIPLWLAGLLPGPVLVAFLLASTSLGVVLSVLTERGLLRKDFGQRLIISAAVADFTTVLLLTIFFSAGSRSTGAQLALIGLLVALALALLLALRLAGRVRGASAFVERLAGATAQIRIRGSFALLLAFVALAEHLGIEVILGAFIAGAILSSFSLHHEHPLFQVKIDAVGYGFFVPVFFILTGARLDIPALLESGDDLVLVPVLLVAIFLVKGLPAMLYRRNYPTRSALAAGALQSAQFTLTVAGVEAGQELGLIDESLGAALISVGLLSILIAPVIFTRLQPRATDEERSALPASPRSAGWP